MAYAQRARRSPVFSLSFAKACFLRGFETTASGESSGGAEQLEGAYDSGRRTRVLAAA